MPSTRPLAHGIGALAIAFVLALTLSLLDGCAARSDDAVEDAGEDATASEGEGESGEGEGEPGLATRSPVSDASG